jgi:hypothetical protein
MEKFQKRACIGLVLVSLLTLLFVAAFEGGFSATPDGTKDSSGAAIGFNNRLTAEHYGIIFGNATLNSSIRTLGVHGCFCVVAHVIGVVLLLCCGELLSRLRTAFFLLQFVIFPTAVLGLVFGIDISHAVLTGQVDGETLGDGISLWWIAQVFWLAACGTVAFVELSTRKARRSERIAAT